LIFFKKTIFQKIQKIGFLPISQNFSTEVDPGLSFLENIDILASFGIKISFSPIDKN
jgi:hypothetical protein